MVKFLTFTARFIKSNELGDYNQGIKVYLVYVRGGIIIYQPWVSVTTSLKKDVEKAFEA